MEREFEPRLTLREKTLRRFLKSYVVDHLLKRYLVCSIRVLWRNDGNIDFNNLYEKRVLIEQEIKSVKEVVFIIDCITSMKKSNGELQFGFAFWVVFDFVESQTVKMESLLTKLIIEKSMDVEDVKSVKSRGKIQLFFILRFVILKFST